ncbi:MAG: pirin family protein [Pseudomonadales bacterium]|nr:pirin family protein [Pseudomonadales bacterium]
MTIREIRHVIPSHATTDGAGVKIQRSIGASPMFRLDPFLMLDEFYSDNPDDYIAGFPSHPHRGFETVTYMLDGHMRHEDHLGNKGDLRAGDVQWMTAAHGIIHSEMPQQTEGRMRGFQLWINLPAAEKMKPAAWQDIPAATIPDVALEGAHVRVIAGLLSAGDREVSGPIHGVSTKPVYFDVVLEPNATFETDLPTGHSAFVYLYEGNAFVGERSAPLDLRAAATLGEGDRVRIKAGPQGASFLLLAAKPLNEPVVQYGPFVMNTREEIEQALSDYRDGTLAA